MECKKRMPRHMFSSMIWWKDHELHRTNHRKPLDWTLFDMQSLLNVVFFNVKKRERLGKVCQDTCFHPQQLPFSLKKVLDKSCLFWGLQFLTLVTADHRTHYIKLNNANGGQHQRCQRSFGIAALFSCVGLVRISLVPLLWRKGSKTPAMFT